MTLKNGLLISFLLLIRMASAQTELEALNETRLKTQKNLMIGLTSWSGVNLVGSGIGWATASNDEMKYFHQMNVFWNTVNLGLAIPGWISAAKGESNLSLAETIQETHRTERIYLLNAGLDVGYMATGMWFRSEAKSNIDNPELFRGYGNSLLIQGGFLFVFDLTAYFLIHKRTNARLNSLLSNVSFSGNGIGISIPLDSKRDRPPSRNGILPSL